MSISSALARLGEVLCSSWVKVAGSTPSPTLSLTQRDKANLDIFWLKDESLEDTENLPAPDVIARDIAENLQAALEQFNSITEELNNKREHGTR